MMTSWIYIQILEYLDINIHNKPEGCVMIQSYHLLSYLDKISMNISMYILYMNINWFYKMQLWHQGFVVDDTSQP